MYVETSEPRPSDGQVVHTAVRDQPVGVIVRAATTERSHNVTTIIMYPRYRVEVPQDGHSVVWWDRLGDCRQLVIEEVFVVSSRGFCGSVGHNNGQVAVLMTSWRYINFILILSYLGVPVFGR